MKKKDVFIGLMFILAAVLVILSRFGVINGFSLFDIFVTVILAAVFLKSLVRLNFYGIFFPAAFICIIYDDQLNITKFTPWPALLTALLLSIGFSLIFNRSRRSYGSNHFSDVKIDEQNSNSIYCSTVFGNCIKYINSPDFKKADIKTSFGDIKMYFDNARIVSGKADIYLNVAFGDVELYIPGDWKVVNNTHKLFGDINISDRSSDSDSPELILHGNISFGDVNIIYVN